MLRVLRSKVDVLTNEQHEKNRLTAELEKKNLWLEIVKNPKESLNIERIERKAERSRSELRYKTLQEEVEKLRKDTRTKCSKRDKGDNLAYEKSDQSLLQQEMENVKFEKDQLQEQVFELEIVEIERNKAMEENNFLRTELEAVKSSTKDMKERMKVLEDKKNKSAQAFEELVQEKGKLEIERNELNLCVQERESLLNEKSSGERTKKLAKENSTYAVLLEVDDRLKHFEGKAKTSEKENIQRKVGLETIKPQVAYQDSEGIRIPRTDETLSTISDTSSLSSRKRLDSMDLVTVGSEGSEFQRDLCGGPEDRLSRKEVVDFDVHDAEKIGKSQKNFIDVLVNKTAKLEIDLTTAYRSISMLQQKRAKDRKTMKEMTMLTNEANSGLESLQRERQADEMDSLVRKSAMDVLVEENSKLKDDLTKAKSTTSMSLQEQMKVEGDMKEIDLRIVDISSDYKSSQKTTQCLQSTIEALRQENVKLKDYLATAKASISEQNYTKDECNTKKMKSRMTNMKREVDKGREEIHNLQQQIYDIEQELHIRDSTITSSKRIFNRKMRTLTDDFKKSKKLAEDEISCLRKKLQFQMDKIERQKKAFQKEKRVLNGKKDEMERKKNEANEEILSLQQKLESYVNFAEEDKTPMKTGALSSVRGTGKCSKEQYEFQRNTEHSAQGKKDTFSIFSTSDDHMDKLGKLDIDDQIQVGGDDACSKNSTETLEERLVTLEKTKNEEIATLVQDREKLLSDMSRATERVHMLEEENKRPKYDFKTSDIKELKMKREQKKRSIQECLRAYELSSSTRPSSA